MAEGARTGVTAGGDVWFGRRDEGRRPCEHYSSYCRGGGDVRMWGARSDKKRWRTSIPARAGAVAARVVVVQAAAVVTTAE